VRKQKRRTARVSDFPLVDEEGIDEQSAARADPFEQRCKQSSVEKVDAHHVVEGSGAEARTIEIDLDDVDGPVPRPDSAERSRRNVGRQHAVSARGEKQRVPTGARGEIERASGPEKLGVVDEKRGGLGVDARPAAIDLFPVAAVVLRHGRFRSVRERSRSHEHVDARRAVLAKQMRAGPNRGGGGTHVIDQENSLAIHGAAEANCERRANVAPARPFTEAYLGGCGARSHQQGRVQGKTEAARRLSRQEQSLVEAAGSQAFEV